MEHQIFLDIWYDSKASTNPMMTTTATIPSLFPIFGKNRFASDRYLLLTLADKRGPDVVWKRAIRHCRFFPFNLSCDALDGISAGRQTISFQAHHFPKTLYGGRKARRKRCSSNILRRSQILHDWTTNKHASHKPKRNAKKRGSCSCSRVVLVDKPHKQGQSNYSVRRTDHKQSNTNHTNEIKRKKRQQEPWPSIRKYLNMI